MKIRKFNESADKEIDAEYVRYCFADLIDSGVATLDERESAAYVEQWGNGKWLAMGIDLKVITIGEVNSSPPNTIVLLLDSNTSLGKHIDAYESNNNVYQEVKLALERLSEEYPNYKIKVDIYSSVISIKLFT